MARIYRPNPGQKAFHNGTGRFRGLFGGRGSGKTVAGGLEALRMIQERPGWPGLIIAPDNRHLRRSTWPEFARWLPWSQVVEHHKTDSRIVFRNGSTIYYGGIDDPNSWRGPNVNWFWFR